jgi:hypothetical protein
MPDDKHWVLEMSYQLFSVLWSQLYNQKKILDFQYEDICLDYPMVSGRSGSNRRRTAWKAAILPLNYTREVGGCHSSHARLATYFSSDAK